LHIRKFEIVNRIKKRCNISTTRSTLEQNSNIVSSLPARDPLGTRTSTCSHHLDGQPVRNTKSARVHLGPRKTAYILSQILALELVRSVLLFAFGELVKGLERLDIRLPSGVQMPGRWCQVNSCFSLRHALLCWRGKMKSNSPEIQKSAFWQAFRITVCYNMVSLMLRNSFADILLRKDSRMECTDD